MEPSARKGLSQESQEGSLSDKLIKARRALSWWRKPPRGIKNRHDETARFLLRSSMVLGWSCGQSRFFLTAIYLATLFLKTSVPARSPISCTSRSVQKGGSGVSLACQSTKNSDWDHWAFFYLISSRPGTQGFILGIRELSRNEPKRRTKISTAINSVFCSILGQEWVHSAHTTLLGEGGGCYPFSVLRQIARLDQAHFNSGSLLPSSLLPSSTEISRSKLLTVAYFHPHKIQKID